MESSGHRDMARAPATEVYLARPYRSRERGLDEHTNGLLRKYVGKSESLFEVAPDRLRRATDLINHLPRKALQFPDSARGTLHSLPGRSSAPSDRPGSTPYQVQRPLARPPGAPR